MRAILYDRYGPPDVLRLTNIDEPVPGPGQIRVRVEVAGVNPIDAKQRRGDCAAIAPVHFPQQLGNEYAGTIDAVAADVTTRSIGDAVLGSAAACGGCRASDVAADRLSFLGSPDQLADRATQPADVLFERESGRGRKRPTRSQDVVCTLLAHKTISTPSRSDDDRIQPVSRSRSPSRTPQGRSTSRHAPFSPTRSVG